MIFNHPILDSIAFAGVFVGIVFLGFTAYIFGGALYALVRSGYDWFQSKRG